MALLPLLFGALWVGLQQPCMLMAQDFGLDLLDEDLRPSIWTDIDFPPIWPFYNRPWADLLRAEGRGKSVITADNHTFKVILDVEQFKPEEIKVKVVNRFVVIEAKHEEKKDKHGLVSRQFIRKYFVPNQVDIEQLKSTISSDGVLTIVAPVKKLPKQTGKPAIPESAEKSKESSTDETDKPVKERVIKVEKTGKPAIRESTKKPKQPSTDNTDKTGKEEANKVEQTGKPVIPESAKQPEETSTDKTVKTGKEKVLNAKPPGKPVIPESAKQPEETSTDKTDKKGKENVLNAEQTGKPVIPESAKQPEEISTDKSDKLEKQNVKKVE